MSLEVRRGEIRAIIEEDGQPVIEGRAIVFGSPSDDLGGFREIIEQGSVNFTDDVVLDFDHKTQYILGRQSNGTLDINVSPDGVSFRARPPQTQWVRDLIESMKGGYINQCSFMFRCREDEWQNAGEDTGVIRRVKDALVSALSVVSMPAYPQTTAEARDKAAELKEAPEPPAPEPVPDIQDGKPVEESVEGKPQDAPSMSYYESLT